MENEKLYGIINTSSSINGEISSNDSINGNIGAGVIKIPIKDHSKLDNRDLDDQHPINSISGLKDELLSIKNSISNNQLSIKNIETKINNKVRTSNNIPIDMQVGEYVYLIKEE